MLEGHKSELSTFLNGIMLLSQNRAASTEMQVFLTWSVTGQLTPGDTLPHLFLTKHIVCVKT